MYMALWWAPYVGWLMLLALLVSHWCFSFFRKRSLTDMLRDNQTQPSSVGPNTSVIRSIGISVHENDGHGSQTPAEVICLDLICKPYMYVLVSARVFRAATASLAGIILFTAPYMVFLSATDYEFSKDPLRSLMVGSAFTVFLAIALALFFSVLHALWRGSVVAAWIVLVITGVLSAAYMVTVLDDILEQDREPIINGFIWYYVLDFFLTIILLLSMCLGSLTIVRRHDDIMLMKVLRGNVRRGWRTAVLQLTGIILPRRFSLKALYVAVLSVLAFGIEGAAFDCYFHAGDRILKFVEKLSRVVEPMSLIEKHYFSIITIACGIAPTFFVSTQMVLSLSDWIRSLARRASIRSAEEALKEEQRPPVLFLRDFRNDQVSLKAAAMPKYLRLFDPGIQQVNLEEVLQNCLSFGPLVGLGCPDDFRPPVGASRKYLREGGWQDEILALMDEASFVVVGVSESEGVLWEIDQLIERGHLGKSLFVLPPEECGNLQLVIHLLLKLLQITDESQRDRVTAELKSSLGEQFVVGVTKQGDRAKLFVSHKRLSPVQYDVVLRLTAPSIKNGERPNRKSDLRCQAA
jgi:hypothetical protein